VNESLVRIYVFHDDASGFRACSVYELPAACSAITVDTLIDERHVFADCDGERIVGVLVDRHSGVWLAGD
jgi:hypothetical protein